MKLILLDGGPASGKNTLGTLLIQEFKKQSVRIVLLDLDAYVEELNPSWIWENNQKEEKDQLEARINFAKDIDKYLNQDYIVIAIGERFLTKEDISSIYLYHLSTPFSLRMQRLHERGRHTLIDLEKDQRERDLNIKWYGYIYNNINSKYIDAQNLLKLIQNDKGLVDINLFK